MHLSSTLHCMKGLSRTKMGIRVRTMKSMKSQKAKPPTFLRAISFTCRLSRYHWFPSERSKQTNTTFKAAERQREEVEKGKCSEQEKLQHAVTSYSYPDMQPG